jgi:tellurite resistance protein TehA-like permease
MGLWQMYFLSIFCLVLLIVALKILKMNEKLKHRENNIGCVVFLSRNLKEVKDCMNMKNLIEGVRCNVKNPMIAENPTSTIKQLKI